MLQEKENKKKRVNWFFFKMQRVMVCIVDILNSQWFLYLFKNIFCTCKVDNSEFYRDIIWRWTMKNRRLRLSGLTYKLAITGICTEDWKQVIKLEYVVFLKWVHE